VPVQAGWVQLIITRNLIARLPRSQPSVNFSAFDMLTTAAFSRHIRSPLNYPFAQERPPRNIRLCDGHPATISGRIPIPLNLWPSTECVKVYGLKWTLPPRASKEGGSPLAQNESRDLVSLNSVPFRGVFGKNWRPEILKASARRGTKNASTHGAHEKLKNRD